jgi:hypothetical protein
MRLCQLYVPDPHAGGGVHCVGQVHTAFGALPPVPPVPPLPVLVLEVVPPVPVSPLPPPQAANAVTSTKGKAREMERSDIPPCYTRARMHGEGYDDPLAAAFPGLSGAVPRALIAMSSILERQGVLHGPLPPLREALAREIVEARRALDGGDLDAATDHASRVHVLGSFYALTHWYSHETHLRVELRRGNLYGVATQALRLAGTPFTRLVVPFVGVTGHPGTSERAIGTRWAIERELLDLLDAQPRPSPPFGLRLFREEQP